jgi:hypothetical protein
MRSAVSDPQHDDNVRMRRAFLPPPPPPGFTFQVAHAQRAEELEQLSCSGTGCALHALFRQGELLKLQARHDGARRPNVGVDKFCIHNRRLRHFAVLRRCDLCAAAIGRKRYTFTITEQCDGCSAQVSTSVAVVSVNVSWHTRR